MHTPVRKTFLGLDIVGFTRPDRTDRDCLAMRGVLYDALATGLRRAGIRPAACEMLDRGDGIMSLLDDTVEPGLVLDTVVPSLVAALRHHNTTANRHARIQLRAVLHTGTTVQDARGYAGRDISHAFRLLDAPELRLALTDSRAELVLAVTETAWDGIRPDLRRRPVGRFRRTLLSTKETAVQAWVTIVAPDPLPAGRPHPVPSDEETTS
ncbi:hypothetical protein BCL76_11285 [Streptomyces sp. CG 926]|uniref:hypothetical protein n=1 Tax=Streptomyces sp. CG 926 TaxID=1882405 RepID=UPI000D6CD6A5|nr:hypothetical protein [Streptomyces sp. CG 926]PWK65478.1 hypothetical protein BCL76_11285 [Streptomyces sp. CG 926]